MKKILFIILMATCTISISAQKKNVIIDVSHDVDTIYAYVNPNIFNLYKDIVEKQMGANLIINKDKELNEALLSEADLLVILSPLNRERVTTKRSYLSRKERHCKLCTERRKVDPFHGRRAPGRYESLWR